MPQPVRQNPFGGSNDIFGGGSDGLFGEMQAAGPTFPAYTFEDGALALGFHFRREMGASNNHTLTAVFKNKTSVPIEGVGIQVAAQKYMVLKIQPPSGSTLAPLA